MPDPNQPNTRQPGDTQPAPTNETDAELKLITLLLEARGWRVIEARVDGNVLTIITTKTAPSRRFTVLDMNAER